MQNPSCSTINPVKPLKASRFAALPIRSSTLPSSSTTPSPSASLAKILSKNFSTASRACPNSPPAAPAAARAFVIARSRLAEDALAEAIAGGVHQYVILGAGLDTSAYRSDQSNLRTVEVDHPATQTWKRGLLAKARIKIPDSTTFVPVDFERESLNQKLAAAGFNDSAPAFFSWLGVVMYLSIESFRQTLAWLGQRPKRTQVIFDYAASLDQLSPRERSVFDLFQTRLTAAGEPFRLFLPSDQMAKELRTAGFKTIEDLDADSLNARYFANRADNLCVEGRMGRLLWAGR